MNTTYKSNNNVVYSCKYHVVWCPKHRRKVLINGVDVRLKELLTEYAANLSVDILEMESMPDHVHMLLEVDPQFGIHKAVKSFKGNKDIYQKTDEKYNSSPASHHHTQLIFLSQRSVKDCKNQNRKNTAQKYSCNYSIYR
jgi:putative transposase